MSQATLTIASRNYGAWSLRGWLLCRFAGLDVTVRTAPSDASTRAELLLLSPSFLVPRLEHRTTGLLAFARAETAVEALVALRRRLPGTLEAVELFLADGVSRRTGLLVSVEGSPAQRLPAATETALYRIVQEVLTNVTKHAQATRVRIRFQRDGRLLRCSIRDDGVGFDVLAATTRRGSRGLGLIGIQERLNAAGGTLNILSAPGSGTEVIITTPAEA